MYYGIWSKSLRTHAWEIMEGSSAEELIQKGWMGVFVNKDDAEWVLDMLTEEVYFL